MNMSLVRWGLGLGIASSFLSPVVAAPQQSDPALAAERGQALLEKLAVGHPELRVLVKRYPDLLSAFADEETAEILRSAPKLPGVPWRVHDIRRPQPRIVTPGYCDTRPPPNGTVMLFNGRNLQDWTGENLADWNVSNGVLTAGGKNFNMIRSSVPLGDARIHLEFREPAPPQNFWQHRGNGGLYLMGRYEVQILDSYRNPTFPDGQAGAIFGQSPPLVNPSAPPGQWQCYDLTWRAPLFAGKRLIAPARLTVWYNGWLIHRSVAVAGPTNYGVITPYSAHGSAPIELQDHGDAAGRVSYRNFWVRPLPSVHR